jgi:Na+-transporting methylmalonyl-CoA/oxaloacetate decarboxylase gamma subunit
MAFGMGLVFFSLTVLMFAMMILERAFRVKAPGEEDEASPSPTEDRQPGGIAQGVPDANLPDQPPAKVAAAIALAMARARADNGRAVHYSRLPVSNPDAPTWDWLWDEGVDDYGTAKGSDYAKL